MLPTRLLLKFEQRDNIVSLLENYDGEVIKKNYFKIICRLQSPS